MSKYDSTTCIELASERYEPEEMTAEGHAAFVYALLELADRVKDELNLDEDDVQEFLADPDEFDLGLDEDEE